MPPTGGRNIGRFSNLHIFLVRAHRAAGSFQVVLAPVARAWPASGARSPFAEYDPALVQIVGRHFDLNPIANDGPDAMSSHPAGRVGNDTMIVFQKDAEAPVRKDLVDQAVEGHQILFGHDLIRPAED